MTLAFGARTAVRQAIVACGACNFMKMSFAGLAVTLF